MTALQILCGEIGQAVRYYQQWKQPSSPVIHASLPDLRRRFAALPFTNVHQLNSEPDP
jgi:hypothetical protein